MLAAAPPLTASPFSVLVASGGRASVVELAAALSAVAPLLGLFLLGVLRSGVWLAQRFLQHVIKCDVIHTNPLCMYNWKPADLGQTLSVMFTRLIQR